MSDVTLMLDENDTAAHHRAFCVLTVPGPYRARTVAWARNVMWPPHDPDRRVHATLACGCSLELLPEMWTETDTPCPNGCVDSWVVRWVDDA